jgi:MFS family permease
VRTDEVATAGQAPWNRSRHLQLAAFWFGLYFLFTPIGTSLVPDQVDDLVPHDRQALAIGVLLGLGAFLAMTVAPFVGLWSDRVSTRFGRRRPFIVVGAAATAASLVIMATAQDYPVLVLGYCAVQLFANAAGAAYSGIIPDVVPEESVGTASGWLAVMVLVGSAAGLLANVALAGIGLTRVTYLVIGAVLCGSVPFTLRAARGEGSSPPAPRDTRPLGERARDFVAPLRRGDFAWVVFTRLLNNAGIAAVTPFTLNFFRDVVGVGNPGLFNPVWYLVVLAFAGPFGYLGGRLSDRTGRKPFVYWSGGLQAAVALVFIAVYPRSAAVVLLLGAAYGVGYGLYNAVDWALACDTLPDRTRSAKDMGLFHIALTLPGNVVPFFAGVVLDRVDAGGGVQGYRLVFGSAALFFLVSTVLVRRVRSVR